MEDEQGPGYLASQESYGFDEDVLDMDEYEGVIDHDLGDLPVGWAASGAGLDAYHVLGDATLSDYASTMLVTPSAPEEHVWSMMDEELDMSDAAQGKQGLEEEDCLLWLD